MNFSWSAWLITVLVVILEALLAWLDGAFSSRQWRKLKLSFLRHWGISIGDLIILPIFNGLAVAYLVAELKKNPYILFLYVGFLVLAVVTTWYAHKMWWPRNPEGFGHIFSSWEFSDGDENFWLDDLTQAGIVHFLFMIFQLVIVMGYILAPMPKETVKIIGILFAIFLPVSTIEPGIAAGEAKIPGRCKMWAWMFTGEMILVALVTWIKM